MLLLIDIGNTNTSIGFYDKVVKDVLRLRTVRCGREGEELTYIIKGFIEEHLTGMPDGVAVSSVVPSITPLLSDVLKRDFRLNPMIINHRMNTGLKFKIKNPSDLGTDRIAAAAGAHKLYKGDLIVVDFGTATTLCAITGSGEYLGGAIMPGIGISAEVLSEKTEKLPIVDLKEPGRVPGRDTKENILAGLVFGHSGGVERIIKEIRKETGINFKVVATGGMSGLVAPYIKSIKYVNQWLALEGLRIIFELNA